MIAVGVDTHKQRHHAVALDHLGQMLAELVFSASTAGYRELQRWAEVLAAGRELVFGIEGAGLCEHLQRERHQCWRSSAHAAAIAEPGNLTASTRSPPQNACLPTRTSRHHDDAAFSLQYGRS